MNASCLSMVETPAPPGDSYWLVVRFERKWAPADMIQRFAIVVTLEADSDQLYERISQRVKVRVRSRS